MTAELVDLEHALDLANKVSLAGAPSAVKCEALATVQRLQSKFDSLNARVLTGFEATQEHRVEGHSSPIGWLKSHCRVRGPDASRRRRTARRLRTMPLVEEALTAGLITVEHVEVLARAQTLLGEEIFSVLEEPLVDAAIAERFGDFERTVEYAVLRSVPWTAEERASRQLEDRYASSSRTFGGAGKVECRHGTGRVHHLAGRARPVGRA